MKILPRFPQGFLAVLLASLGLQAGATPMVFNGSDQFAKRSVPPPIVGNSAFERNRFLDALVTDSVKIESFTSNRFSDPDNTTSPQKLNFSGVGGTLTADLEGLSNIGRVTDFVGDANGIPGRFNTTPTDLYKYYWESYADFTITLKESVSAFGFFGTDFFDFGGSLTLNFLQDGVSVYEKTLAPVTPNGNDTDNGSLNFFGFAETDQAKRFNTVKFTITQKAGTEMEADYLGFDDFIVGEIATTPPVDLPEPATLALVGVSLFGIAATRRRQRR